MSQRSDALWQVIKIAAPFIPAAGPYIAIAERVWPAVRAVFVKEGGDAADFDALMAETRRNIDLLANPSGFFGPRHDAINQPPQPIPPNQDPVTNPPSMYATLMPGAVLDDETLLSMGYQMGDKVCTAGTAWMMIKKGQPTLGATVLRTIGDSE